jgi:CheY-like chemotaxis protein
VNISEAAILLVDDEPALLEIFQHVLHSFGCVRVYVASNGEEALSVLRAEDVDLMITDVRMPVMDGITLVRRLAEIGKTVPSIVFVSGFGDLDLREMYMLGVESFLTKPFDREELLEAVLKALADRSTLWRNEMAVSPKQSVLLRSASFGEISGISSICLGRGGLTAYTLDSLNIGKVSFRCMVSDKELNGQGYVRWVSRPERKIGIEFAYIDPLCGLWLAEKLVAKAPRSFIPGS